MEYASAEDPVNDGANKTENGTANKDFSERPQTDAGGTLRHFEGEEIPSPDDLLVLSKAGKRDTARSTAEVATLDRSMGQPLSEAFRTASDAGNNNSHAGSQATSSTDRSRLPEGTVSTLQDVEQRLGGYMKPISEGPFVRYRKVVEVAERIFIEYRVGIDKNFSIRLKFDRTEKANALSAKLMTDLTLVFQALAKLENLACVVLTSQNSTRLPPKTIFCGGADVQDMLSINTPAEAEAFIRTVSGLCTAVRNLPAPVVAEIDGPCIGAGLEVAAACDIRIASTEASFSMPEVKLGIPSVVEARLLCDIVGWGRARHLMLTGERWTAEEALQAGLVTKLFDGKMGLRGVSLVYMQDMATNPAAYKAQKTLMRAWENCSIEGGIEAGVKAFADVWSNEDTKNTTKSLMGKPRKEKLPGGVDSQDQRKQFKKADGVRKTPGKVDAHENVVRRIAGTVKEAPEESETGAISLRKGNVPRYQIRKHMRRHTSANSLGPHQASSSD